MRDQIEAIALEGQTLRVTAGESLRVEPRVLALATALRVFERYPVLDRLALARSGAEIVVTREEVTRLLGPEGFAPLSDRKRFGEILARGAASAGEERAG